MPWYYALEFYARILVHEKDLYLDVLIVLKIILCLRKFSAGPEIIFLCSDCYNLKYSKEAQNEIKYVEKEKAQKEET